MNKYYQPGAQRAARVGDLFAAVAPRYDLINDLQSAGLHRLWKRELVRMAEARPGDAALDVCCGTGDIALALHRAGAAATGIDFSAAMLAIARQRAGTAPVAFIEGDALALPFEKNRFDVVTVGYGLRNLSDWEAGLAEMRRVARPGGRLLALDFGKPDNPAWRAIYFGYLRRVAPLLGRVFCRDAEAYAYILASLRDYPAQRGVAVALEKLGCRDVRTRNFLGGAMSVSFARK